MKRMGSVVCALVLAWAFAAAAEASPRIHYGIQDDAWIFAGPGTLDSRLDQLKSLGVNTVRFSIHWDQIAPTRPLRALAANDPAYKWGGVDAVLTGLRARGIEPLVTLYGTPPWANGGRKPNVAPTSASAFADFAYAAAKRYPFVRDWTVWSEPNQRISLLSASPSVYVKQLLNPAYVAIHRANPKAVVAGGVTAPRGNSGGMGPLAFVRGMKAAHAKLDAYAHNPYPTHPSVESPFAGACSYCDVISMANLGRLLTEVHRDFGNKPVWLTEYGYQTNPPDQILGVSPVLQAIYVGESALRAYELPNVTMLINFLVRDEPDVGRFQSGLVTVTGQEKPSYTAFRFPLAQAGRAGNRVTLWGQVRPGSGARTYRLQLRSGASWRWLGSTMRTNGLGFFSRSVAVPRGSAVRFWSPENSAYSWPIVLR
ncbi:MAG: glycoside hydrolase 5 family protein [Gaiellaceae bacterium]